MDNIGKLRDVQFEKGQGVRLWSSDGREFIDFTCSWGTMTLGYGDPRVVAAAIAYTKSGVMFPGGEHLSDNILYRLQKLYHGSEKMLVFKTGTEACMAAVRICRAATGRKLVLCCGYHGWADWCNRGIGTIPREQRNRERTCPPGILDTTAVNTLDIIDPDDINEVERMISEKGHLIACFILDPTELSQIPTARLGELKNLCRSRGIVFVLDELKSAFRVSPKGAQGLSGVDADITILGKGIANGFPISLLLGIESILNSPHAFNQGTFSSERVSLGVTLATIDAIVEGNLNELMTVMGSFFITEMNKVFRENSLEAVVQAVPWSHPTMPFLEFSKDILLRERKQFFNCMFDAGIAWYMNHMCFISAAHDREILSEALQRISEACKRYVRSR